MNNEHSDAYTRGWTDGFYGRPRRQAFAHLEAYRRGYAEGGRKNRAGASVVDLDP